MKRLEAITALYNLTISVMPGLTQAEEENLVRMFLQLSKPTIGRILSISYRTPDLLVVWRKNPLYPQKMVIDDAWKHIGLVDHYVLSEFSVRTKNKVACTLA